MNMLIMKGNWNIVLGRVKQELARLTHDNKQFMKGMEEELTGRIQKRAGQNDKRPDVTDEHAESKSHKHFKS